MPDSKGWNVPNVIGAKRVTLHDVAWHVGVSKSTVSLVLQGSPHVSLKIRERILRGIYKASNPTFAHLT
ncbi:MAG: hypothetical protein CR991_07970 [Proteobacteria bacterium]|nr:MAG: hypothetical protein CR991_07970 [Pseudomonadota bacterium]